MNILKFGAIDIGSNAVRLLITNVIENETENKFLKSTIIRLPIRLGDDTFVNGKISNEKTNQLVLAMQSFKNLMTIYEVIDYKACATAALREAKNAARIVRRLKFKTDIDIELISGKREAEIINLNKVAEMLNRNRAYFYIDIGGGSLEITLFSDDKIIESESFRIGTVRTLQNISQDNELMRLEFWLLQIIKSFPNSDIIASGGNMNRLFKISGKKEGSPISYYHILDIYENLNVLSYEERIKTYKLNTDRADVILPAIATLINIMQITKIRQVYVPKVGLSDGIIHMLYDKYMNNAGILTT